MEESFCHLFIFVGLLIMSASTITAVAVDLRGFSNALENSHTQGTQADFARKVGQIYEWAELTFKKGGGCTISTTGDGVIAFVEGPNNASRALFAALTLRESLVRADLESWLGQAPGFGIGIERGLANAAAGQQLVTWLGPCVNAAARMEKLSKQYSTIDTVLGESLINYLALSHYGIDLEKIDAQLMQVDLQDAARLGWEAQRQEALDAMCLEDMQKLQINNKNLQVYGIDAHVARSGNPRYQRLMQVLENAIQGR